MRASPFSLFLYLPVIASSSSSFFLICRSFPLLLLHPFLFHLFFISLFFPFILLFLLFFLLCFSSSSPCLASRREGGTYSMPMPLFVNLMGSCLKREREWGLATTRWICISVGPGRDYNYVPNLQGTRWGRVEKEVNCLRTRRSS